MSRAHRNISRAAAAATLLNLAACTYAPTSAPPSMPEPVQYGAAPVPERTVAAQGTAQQFVQQAQAVPAWWRLYRCDALDTLVDEGLRSSPTLEAADHRLAAARDMWRANSGTLWPALDLGDGAQRGGIPGFIQPGPDAYRYDVFAGRLQGSYNFDLFGATRYANAALAARVDEEAYRFDAARRALAANIVTTVIAAAVARAQIAQTEQLVALANRLADEAQERHDAGVLAFGDVLIARQAASSLSAGLPALHQQQTSASHALAALLGRTPDDAPADIDLAQLHLPGRIPVTVPSALLKTRPDIQAAEATLRAAAADVGAATARFFPDISLTAAFGRAGLEWLPALSGAGAIWSVGASLSQPLFHGGALVAQRHSAQHAYEAAVAQYRATVIAAFANVSDALAALINDAQACDAAHSAADDAQTIADQAAARLRAGAVPATAVHLSEQRWRTARLDEIRYMGARLTDTAVLFQAFGSPTQAPTSHDDPAVQASLKE